jgi:hypothetical protein
LKAREGLIHASKNGHSGATSTSAASITENPNGENIEQPKAANHAVAIEAPATS